MKSLIVIAILAGISLPAEAQDFEAFVPTSQKGLVLAVKAAVEAYTGSGNDLQRGAARPARAHAICKAVPKRRADRWIGKLKTISTNSDGWGVLAVSLTPQITVGTMPNSWADIKDKTLISPKSPVYASAAKLKEGDLVVFSGTFANGDTDCFGEKSLTMSGSMMRPDFVFRFSAISRFDPPAPKPGT